MTCVACVSYRDNDGKVASDSLSFHNRTMEYALREAKAILEVMGYKVYHVVVVRV